MRSVEAVELVALVVQRVEVRAQAAVSLILIVIALIVSFLMSRTSPGHNYMPKR